MFKESKKGKKMVKIKVKANKRIVGLLKTKEMNITNFMMKMKMKKLINNIMKHKRNKLIIKNKQIKI